MNATEIYCYKGFEVGFTKGRDHQVMINATQMAQPFGKRTNDYLNLTSTNELIKALLRKTGKSIHEVVNSRQGSMKHGGGTWMHQTLALDFAQWLSVDFKLWCLEKVEQVLDRKPQLDKALALELLQKPWFIAQMATVLAEQTATLGQNEMRIMELKQERDALRQKLRRYNTLLDAPGTMPATLIAKELGLAVTTLNRKLREQNVQYKQGENWMLRSPYDKRGYVQYRTLVYGDQTKRQMMWTEKGRMFIHELFDEKKD